MGSEEGKLKSELQDEVFKIFSGFMIWVTKLEELMSVGSSLLVGFQQGLDFLRRPPIDRTSELVKRIIKANETKRVSSYVEAGCVSTDDSKQNISKLYRCQLGLWKHVNEAECVMEELKCLLENATVAMQKASESSPLLQDKDTGDESDPLATTNYKEQKPEVTDYAAMMAILYSMVKQDCIMQEKIVTSLSLKSSSEELESYCLMWSLRPFVDDEIMCEAWKLLP
ncbi:unnamed protein product [Ilex paraguariensis]|uniref:DUF7795 domain-containing protein n=1 Tax=Ilex paraguariensis TaxID=185542 RepID=A0ABC8QTP2_9AQUA